MNIVGTKGVDYDWQMWHTLRTATRALRARPIASGAIVGILAGGIGANTAMFLLVDATLFRPLPFPSAERIVRVIGKSPQALVRFDVTGVSVWPETADPRVFGAIGVYSTGGLNLGGSDHGTRVRAAAVTPGFFDVLGVRPTLGRVFTSDDDQRAGLAVVAHKLWKRSFGGDAGLVGRTVVLNGRSVRVTGVMPESVDFPDGADVWIPSGADPQLAADSAVQSIVARLAPGVGRQQARDFLARIDGSEPVDGSTSPFGRLRVIPLAEYLTAENRPILSLLAAATALVFLVSCVNVANLLLVQLAAREREFAVRRALGATGFPLVRQIVCEGLLLSALAAAVSLPLAMWTLSALRSAAPPSLQPPGLTAFTWRAVVATVVLGLSSTAVFGVAPAMSVAGRQGHEALRTAAMATTRPIWKRFRSGLVIVQISLAVALLVGAATIVRQVASLQRVDLGFAGPGLLTAELVVPKRVGGRPPGGSWNPYYERLLVELGARPGIQAAGIAERIPNVRPSSPLAAVFVELEGQPLPSADRERVAIQGCVSAAYFDAIGVRLVAGRRFNEHDTGSPKVAILSERYAWAVGLEAAQVVGRRANLNATVGGAPDWGEVVGVVRDVRFRGPESEWQAAIYEPCAQNPPFASAVVVVRSAQLTGGDLARALREAAAATDPDVPLYNLQTLDDIRRGYLEQRRFAMVVVLAFAALTFLLAAAGLYALIAHVVEVQRREVGIRMAVGASPLGIRLNILRGGLIRATWGAVLGIAIAFVGWRLAALQTARLGRISGGDALLVAASLLGVALVATWMPAQRATRVDPATVLRDD